MSGRDDLLELADRFLDGTLDSAHLSVLDARLRGDPQSCRLFWAVIAHELLLRQQPATMPTAAPIRSDRQWWRRPRWAIAAAAALLLVALVGALWRGGPGRVIAQVVAVSAPTGVVGERQRDGRAGEALREGQAVLAGDRLAIAAGATVEVRLAGEDTVFGLGSGSVCTIDDGPVGARVRLAAGGLDASVAHQPSGRQVSIATPEATVVVIGTRLAVTVTPGRTSVEVDAGRVRVTAGDASVGELGPGQAAVALAGRPLAISEAPPLRWPDRRPIGVMMLCRATAGWATNPRGWFGDTKVDVTTPAGRAAFAQRLDKMIDTTIADLREMDAQAVVFWDLEGSEFAPGYIGDPRLLPRLAPEMDAAADRMFARLRAAGVAVGMVIRTEAIVLPATGGLTVHRLDDPVREVQARIAYARQRWGATVFPLIGDGGAALTMTAICRRLGSGEPGILLIPTAADPETYRWSAPWHNPMQATESDPAGKARQARPEAFAVIAPLEKAFLAQHHDELVKAVAAGDVMTFRAWNRNAEEQAVKAIYAAAKSP